MFNANVSKFLHKKSEKAIFSVGIVNRFFFFGERTVIFTNSLIIYTIPSIDTFNLNLSLLILKKQISFFFINSGRKMCHEKDREGASVNLPKVTLFQKEKKKKPHKNDGLTDFQRMQVNNKN